MKNSWAQPSLSRDFILLSGAVIFVLTIVSVWVTFNTYEKHSRKITADLGLESLRIDKAIAKEMIDANFMLASLGRQIIIEPDRDYTKLAQSLKSFDNKNYIYSIFSWINTDKKMVVSSNRGVLEEPVDLSDRDFIQDAATDSWKMHIGKPIEGRVSGRWVIPMAMGITDYTGKFIGIIALSMDIEVLTTRMHNLVKRDGISFAIINKVRGNSDYRNDNITLTEVSDVKNFVSSDFPLGRLSEIDVDQNPRGLIAVGSLILGSGTYSYYRVSEDFPYIVLMSYDANFSDETVRTMLLSRLMQIFLVAVFFVVFLWIVRMRVIGPVMEITEVVASIVRGNKFVPMPKKGQVELEALVYQVEQVSKYVDENKRIENELRNKVFQLKKSKEKAEIDVRSKNEFMDYVAQEMRLLMNNIIGFSQVLKDQVYGPIENRKYKQYATDIFTVANHMVDKIKDISLLAKTEIGQINLQEKELDVKQVVTMAIKQIDSMIEGKKLTLASKIEENLPLIIADEFRMQQIMVNVLLLAIDQAKEQGVINIAAKIVRTNYDKQLFVLSVSSAVNQINLDSAVAVWNNAHLRVVDSFDIRFEMIRSLVALHGGVLHVEDGNYMLILPDSRLVLGIDG